MKGEKYSAMDVIMYIVAFCAILMQTFILAALIYKTINLLTNKSWI